MKLDEEVSSLYTHSCFSGVTMEAAAWRARASWERTGGRRGVVSSVFRVGVSEGKMESRIQVSEGRVAFRGSKREVKSHFDASEVKVESESP